MRILLAHNSTYYPSHGGGDKSNRLLMEALAARGHEVRVVSRVENFGPADHAKLLEQLRERGQEAVTDESGAVRLTLNGVDVRTVALTPHLRAYFSQQLEEFDPDIVITSTDDPGQLLFDLALRAPRARVVYLVRATIAVPFGPDSSMVSAAKTDTLRHADGVVGVSHYVAGYVRQWTGIPAIHVPISLLEGREFPDLRGPENKYVAMVNPCLVKGITIFLELADRMPDVPFAAIPTWGATEDDLAELRKRPNVTLLKPVDDINDLLRLTKVMLVPSVWAEARSRIVLESMACGIPVVASAVGGLSEAHLGVPYLLPVRPVTHYKQSLDRNMVPIAEVPPQDVGPWQAAIEKLLTDPAHYEEIAGESRRAALDYAANLNVLPFEAFLQDLLSKPKKGAPAPPVAKVGPDLSDEKRKLLALRLKQRGAAAKPAPNPWFSGLEDREPGKLTLVCLPYAGGGTMPYRSWRQELSGMAVVAVRLPGRETRLQEQPFESMESLVDTLGPELVKAIPQPFALYGHSMGAGITFELTRWLRRNGHPLPVALAVSSARAPQLRSQPVDGPEPDDAVFLEQIRRLDGIPADVLENPELLRLVLPVLRADARLYRRYLYKPEPPLPVPLFVYGGASDPSLQAEHLDVWCEQTTSRCIRRNFPGGHFFLQSEREALLDALRRDVVQESRLHS